MKEARLTVLFALPLAWSAALAAETRTEMINQVLGALLIGALPLLAAMLLWDESFRGADVDVRYGQNRRRFATKRLAVTLSVLVAAAVGAGTLALGILRGPTHQLFLHDFLATSAVSIAGALSLGCFFGASRVWLGRGGLVAALILTWLLAPMDLVVSAAVPTGHVRSLLGLGMELPFPGWVSFASLYGTAALLGGLLLARIPR